MNATQITAIQKVWGQTRPISGGHGFEVHYLDILERTVCSCHRHATKWNLFYVVSGEIAVHFYDDPGTEPRETIRVEAGHTLQLSPGIWHRFEGLADSQVLEVYWTDPVNPLDIERFDEGRKLYADC